MVDSHDPSGSAAGIETATEQIEMAFVPASERQHATSTTGDTIITVGQRSQQKKKRKRNPASNGQEDDIEVFDYTTEPSLLDVGGMKQVRPVTKKRNRGEHVQCCTKRQCPTLTPSQEPAPVQFGNFPAPPKAHNQPKSGNQSHSFR